MKTGMWALLAMLVSLTASQPMICTIPSRSLPILRGFINNAPSSLISERVKGFVIDVLLDESWGGELALDCIASNALNRSNDTVQQMDQDWRLTYGNLSSGGTISADMNATLTSRTAQYLNAFAARFGAAVAQAFVADAQGVVIGSDGLTSDLWQGDEPKWTEAFNSCLTGVHISPLQPDPDAGETVQFISLPIISDANVAVGAIAWGLREASLPCTIDGPALPVMENWIRTSSLPNRTKQFIIEILLPFSVDPYLATALKNTNDKQIEDSTLRKLDTMWKASILTNNFSNILFNDTINNEYAEYLRNINTEEDERFLGEITLMDIQGQTVAASELIPSYFHGDEPAFLNALSNCSGGADISGFTEKAFDSEDGQWGWRIVFPVTDSENKVLGAISWFVGTPGEPSTLISSFLALRQALENSPDMSERTMVYAVETLLTYTLDYTFVDAVKAANRIGEPLSDIMARDALWKSAIAGGTQSFFELEILNSNVSIYLRQQMKETLGLGSVYHFYVMSYNGTVVAMDTTTPDYYLGDRQSLLNAINNGKGGVYVGKQVRDPNNGLLVQEISLPLLDTNNRVVGAMTFLVAESGLACQGHAILYHDMMDSVNAMPVPDVLKRWFILNLIPEAYSTTYESAAQETDEASFSLAELAQMDLDWRTNSSVRDAVKRAPASLELAAFQAVHPPVSNAWIQSVRGEVVAAIEPPPRYWNMNDTRFLNGFADCNGSTYSPPADYLLHDDPLVFYLSIPSIEDDNTRVFTRTCTQSSVFLILTLIYNLGLLLFGAIISVLGRRYPTAFNESIYLMITMNLLASFSVIILFGQQLTDIQDLAWLNLLAGHLMLWIAMGLVFGSKMFQIITGHADDKVTLVLAPTAEKKDSSSGSTPENRRDTKDVTTTKKQPSTLDLPSKSGNKTQGSRSDPTESQLQSQVQMSPKGEHLPLSDPPELPPIPIPLGEPAAAH